MAGPTTSVLTTFTGADEDPLSEGGNWSTSTIRTAGANLSRCRRVSNVVGQPVSGTVAGESIWAASFAESQEVFCTIAAITASGFNLYARIQNEGGSSVVAYLLSVVSGNVRFFRLSNTTFTQIGSAMTTTVAVGDSILLRVSGTTLVADHKPAAGSWTQIGTETNANVTGAGRLGIGLVAGVNTSLDDFGGGALTLSRASYMLLLGVG